MSQLVEFIGNHPFMVLLFLTVFFLFLRSLYNEKSKAYQNVNIDQLTRLVNHQNAQVVDVRSKEDFAQGHIVNAINIPLDDITAGKAKLDKLKKKPVVVYCQMGRSSATASQSLTAAGVESVFNLQGGINSWISEKLPLSKV
ncbi:MAG: rhodanese-like domain-containing protein [Marinicella sp.]